MKHKYNGMPISPRKRSENLKNSIKMIQEKDQ